MKKYSKEKLSWIKLIIEVLNSFLKVILTILQFILISN